MLYTIVKRATKKHLDNECNGRIRWSKGIHWVRHTEGLSLKVLPKTYDLLSVCKPNTQLGAFNGTAVFARF